MPETRENPPAENSRSPMAQLFNIDEADADDGVITISLRKDFVETVACALKHCPESRRNKLAAGVLSYQLMKIADFLYGGTPLKELVDRNGREIVEMVIQDDTEIEFRQMG
jgi:hypothetical protein